MKLIYALAALSVVLLLADEPFAAITCTGMGLFLMGRHKNKHVGYVYVLESRGLYKIGRTNDLTRRLNEHLTAAPDARYVHTIRSENERALEKELHGLFAAKRVTREWFALTRNDLALIKRRHG